MAVGLTVAVVGLTLSLLGSFFVFAVFPNSWAVSFAKWARDKVRDVVPKAGPFPVRHSIFTIVQVIKGQCHDAFLTLQ
jgi:hypothetical protein